MIRTGAGSELYGRARGSRKHWTHPALFPRRERIIQLALACRHHLGGPRSGGHFDAQSTRVLLILYVVEPYRTMNLSLIHI